eukprot:CAMPEP_0198122896 /NCGR_PEP_ID=MMETSP1442-20131203/36110_1 /TAXON_ID= /ORGANISM="Craspedostauros australis, Strain CCMP3328" /LENGTH=227 /DNA_ID=CAMNT_0043782001 /DNA_START=184 /DNA_END=864 /DNA_ORIENTATION=+
MKKRATSQADRSEHKSQTAPSKMEPTAKDDNSKMPLMRKMTTSLSDSTSFTGDDDSRSADGSRMQYDCGAFGVVDSILVYKIFFHNGLPWEGAQCRAVRSGLSGILYALPMFTSPNPIETAAWVTQAFLSIMADYVCADRPHIVHGLDRISAVTMLIVTVVRSYTRLQWWTVLLAILPLSFFAAGDAAKSKRDLKAWQNAHCGWHITGGILVMFFVKAIYLCPSTEW